MANGIECHTVLVYRLRLPVQFISEKHEVANVIDIKPIKWPLKTATDRTTTTTVRSV
jgi:hypothetical protein